MRITKYSVELDADRKNVLVKENTKNCPEINRLDSPEKIVKMLNDLYHAKSLAEEYMWAIALDTKCQPIGVFEISHGTVDASLITPREIFVRLCLCGASRFVMAHNHPSGDVTPSTQDMQVTKQVKEAGKIMSIVLLDHVIIGEGVYSFRENNII